MTLQEVVQSFAQDDTLKAVAVLIVLDTLLGVTAAVRAGQFAFAKVVGFLRDDVLGKVVPWFGIYAAWKWAPSVEVLGVGLKEMQEAVFALVVVALLASLTSSLADLGLNLPKSLARGESP